MTEAESREIEATDRAPRNSIRRRMAAGLTVLGAIALTPGCYFSEDVKAFLQADRRPVSAVEYRVYPPDVLSIESRNVQEINGGSHRVRPDGKINLPLLGEIFVTGKTPKEIEKLLTDASKEFYEKTDATVQVVGYYSQNYYVFGQVSRPGPVSWTGRDTLLEALARSQPNNLAWAERIMVVRGSKPQQGGYYQEASNPIGKYRLTGVHKASEDNQPKTMMINLVAMVEEGDMANNIMLMPNDVIYVQASPLAKIGLALQRLLFPINPAIQAAGVPANFEQAGDRNRYDR